MGTKELIYVRCLVHCEHYIYICQGKEMMSTVSDMSLKASIELNFSLANKDRSEGNLISRSLSTKIDFFGGEMLNF